MVHRLCLVTATLVFGFAGIGHAEFIGIFRDTSGCPCMVTDRGAGGLMSIVVLHVDSPGTRGSQFSAPIPMCMQVTYISDTAVFPATIGNSQTGVAIGYEACLTGTFKILTINYYAHGLTPDCCYYDVLPDPAVSSGQIEIFDCNNQTVFALGYAEIVNSNVTCQCAPGPVTCYPVAVETSTFGRIKALYQQR